MTDTAAAAAATTIRAYFDAFNAGDAAGMLALVTDDVEHHVSQGAVRHGRAAFAEFCAHMGVSYRETLSDIVIMVNDDGTRAAAESSLQGEYLQTDPGLPEASGQRYSLTVGSFFTLRDGRIARVATHYNLQDWIAQVSG
jgi:steroid delta-isomerase-like uncharacterized protein